MTDKITITKAEYRELIENARHSARLLVQQEAEIDRLKAELNLARYEWADAKDEEGRC